MKKSYTTVLALAFGFILIFWAISIDGSITSFINVPSIAITVFGSFAAVVISFPFDKIKNTPIVLKNLVTKNDNNKQELVETIVSLSRLSRSQGLLALDAEIEGIENTFLAESMKMVVDGMDADNIREILETKIDNIEDRHYIGQEIFLKWGELAPGFGMLGTLIGLINLLGSLTDPSTIGGGMAVALLTTFYGSLLANLIFLPIAQNLKTRTEAEVNTNEMIMEGALAIQAGKNPRVIEQKLESYLEGGRLKEKPEAMVASEEREYV